MLGTSLVLPLLTFETNADLSTSISNVTHPTWSLSHTTRGRSRLLFSTRRKWKLHAVDHQPQVVVLEDDEEAWDQCKQILTALGFTLEQSDVMLKKAFGWVHSPYWGEARKKETPKNDLVNELLDYLKSLSLSDDDLHKLLKKFPEVLGCNLDEEVNNNIATLEKQWGIKGKSLRNLLLRNPKVLGYNVDCKGDCMAQCTRCWVRF